MGKKRRGRPRKKPPVETEFSTWLRAFMDAHGLRERNVAAAVGVRLETVYGWLAGESPETPALIKTALIAIYERDRASGEAS